MDELDSKIIDLLKQDARMSFTKISEKLDVGTDTVIRRYQKLLKTGIISKPVLVLSSKVCGFLGIADFYINLQPQRNVNDVVDEISKIKNIFSIARMLGDFDLLVSAFFTDILDLDKMTRFIKAINNIRSVDVSIYVGPEWTIPMDVDIGKTYL